MDKLNDLLKNINATINFSVNKVNLKDKLSVTDAKKLLNDGWSIVKTKSDEKINLMKKKSFELSKDSVKMVFSTTWKIIYHVSKFGVSSFFVLLNNTKAGLYFKVLAGTYFLTRSMYVYGTFNEDTIIIKNKWIPNGLTKTNKYEIEDENNKVYLLKNSIWYFPLCDADKTFGRIEKNKSYSIKYYGLRQFDMFGFNPIIISMKEKFDQVI